MEPSFAMTAGGQNEIEISDEGVAVIEAGLSLRQAHELKTGCSAENLCDRCRKDLRVS